MWCVKSETSAFFQNGLVQNNKENILLSSTHKTPMFFSESDRGKFLVKQFQMCFLNSRKGVLCFAGDRGYLMVLASVPNHTLFKCSNRRIRKWLKKTRLCLCLPSLLNKQLFASVWCLLARGVSCSEKILISLFFSALCQRVCFQHALILTVNLVTIVQQLNKELWKQCYLCSEYKHV